MKRYEGNPKNQKDLKNIVSKWEDKGLKIDIFESKRKPIISLSSVIISKEQRNKGMGTGFMEDLTLYADDTKKTIELTPSTDYGGTSKKRLINFYKRFGFVENKGKNKDFEIKEDMYYKPLKKSTKKTDILDKVLPDKKMFPLPPIPKALSDAMRKKFNK